MCRFKNIPEKDWPIIQWDESAGNFNKYLDGAAQENYIARHPKGMLIGDVNIANLDAKLHQMSRQSAAEFWELFYLKKVEALEFWALGKKMTPCAIEPHENELQVKILGGNNRLAVARRKGELIVPVLFDPKHQDEITTILTLFNIR